MGRGPLALAVSLTKGWALLVVLALRLVDDWAHRNCRRLKEYSTVVLDVPHSSHNREYCYYAPDQITSHAHTPKNTLIMRVNIIFCMSQLCELLCTRPPIHPK